MSAVRLYVDEDASESAVVLGLRARGVDLVTTFEVGRLGTSDESQLAFAAEDGQLGYYFGDAAKVLPDSRASMRRVGRPLRCSRRTSV